MPDQPKKQIQVKANDDRIVPSFANHIQITHTGEEFLLELYAMYPPQGALISRIVISPQHAKRLQQALNENIGKYEDKFGAIAETAIPFKLNGPGGNE